MNVFGLGEGKAVEGDSGKGGEGLRGPVDRRSPGGHRMAVQESLDEQAW